MPEFKAAAVFSSNMVLQREKSISVFGYGSDGKNVTVTFNNASADAEIKNGSWCVTLPPMSAGEGYEMTISCCGDKILFKNIAVGEVWLAGGQSNMELELQSCKGGCEVLKSDKSPRVRYYYTQKNSYMDDAFFAVEKNTRWAEFDEESAKIWSAVGYFFARKLSAELGVVVGIIGCNWGGTSASAWMSKKRLSSDIELNTYIEDYDNAVAGKTTKQQLEEYSSYAAYQSEWDARAAALSKNTPGLGWEEITEKCGENKWPGPMGCSNPCRPCGLYECMFRRIMPYTLKGFIFYQGESDEYKPRMYFKLFSALIQQWRDDWSDDELPFLFVQLPMHRYAADPDDKHWCLLREAQMRVFKTIKNTGIAVIPDYSEFNEIHPKDKLPVSERLALQALCSVYKKIDENKAFGPIYKSFEHKNGGIELSFDYAENGLASSGKLNGFEIAGSDKVFFKTDAEIRGNKIFAFSEMVKKPLYLRYCWSNYIDVSVFGKNAIPLAPFRTSMNDETE